MKLLDATEEVRTYEIPDGDDEYHMGVGHYFSPDDGTTWWQWVDKRHRKGSIVARAELAQARRLTADRT